MTIYQKSGKLKRCKFTSEESFEREVFEKYKYFFGKNTIYIDAKKKMETKLGNVIPDGFLFNLEDKNNPEFYIVEVELANHSFYDHIFPQITKFIGFINSQNYLSLIAKIFTEIEENIEIKKEFEELGVTTEKYKFILDTMENSSNILLVIDDEKPEIQEMNSVYQEWNKKVKQICIKKYQNASKEIFYDITPKFKDIEDVFENENDDTQLKTEDFHLSNTSDNIKQIYKTIKEKLIKYRSSMIFNPQKYYISIRLDKNISFMIIRQQKIKLIVNMPYDKVKEIIKHNIVQPLSESVQKYYFHKENSCCAIIVNSIDYIDEVLNLIKDSI